MQAKGFLVGDGVSARTSSSTNQVTACTACRVFDAKCVWRYDHHPRRTGWSDSATSTLADAVGARYLQIDGFDEPGARISICRVHQATISERYISTTPANATHRGRLSCRSHVAGAPSSPGAEMVGLTSRQARCKMLEAIRSFRLNAGKRLTDAIGQRCSGV